MTWRRAIAILIGATYLLGCYATTGEPRQDCPRIMDGCNPGDYPPLATTLPPWPFPSLLVPIPEPPPPPKAETPGSRLLQKLTK